MNLINRRIIITGWPKSLSLLKIVSLFLFFTSCSGNVGLKLGSLTKGPSVVTGIGQSPVSDVIKSSTNLVTNPGFESWMYGWNNYGSSYISNQDKYSGLNSLKVGRGSGGVGQDITASFTPAATYRLSGYAKLTGGAEYAHLAIQFFDSSGTEILVQKVIITGSSYQSFSVDFVAPANSSRQTVSIWKNQGSGILTIDDVSLFNLTETLPSNPTASLAMISSSISMPQLTAGELQNVSVSLQANMSFQETIVSIRILDSSSNIIFDKTLDHVALNAGTTTPFELQFQTTAALADGNYFAIIGVWSGDWSKTHLYQTIGSFQLTSAPVAPTPTPVVAPEPTLPVATPAPAPITPITTPITTPAVPVSVQGYAFGSRKDAYVAGIRPSVVSQAAQDAAVQKLYNSWKSTLSASCGGYYVKFNTSYAAVSEGIGYGMLITVLMEGYDSQAHQYFDGLFRFARNHPATNVDPALMDWRVNNDCTSAGGGYNAMDGDLDIAMGLLMADRQWGSAGAIDYKAEAIKTITAMKNKNFNSSGYSEGGPASDLSRTSDYMITHFRAFRKATGDSFWDVAIDKSFQLMTLMQNNFAPTTGLIPDFIVGLPGNPYPSPGGRIESSTEGFFAWNGCRIPWRLGSDYVTSGDTRSKDVTVKIMDFLNKTTGGNGALIAMGYKLDGTPLSTPTVDWTSASFAGPATAGALVDPRFQPFLDNLWALDAAHPATGYYDYELQLLSMIVASGNWWNP